MQQDWSKTTGAEVGPVFETVSTAVIEIEESSEEDAAEDEDKLDPRTALAKESIEDMMYGTALSGDQAAEAKVIVSSKESIWMCREQQMWLNTISELPTVSQSNQGHTQFLSALDSLYNKTLTTC